VIESPVRISASRARVVDKVILNGPIEDHVTTMMIARDELGLDPLYMANEGRLIAVGASRSPTRSAPA
jgi:hydrogenase maturation factor